MPEITKALQSIGLHDKQIRVLNVLLTTGPMFASAIGKAAKLNRSTTYVILKELQEKGLTSSAKEESATRFQSIAPELLPGYIDRKREELEESKTAIENILPQIKMIRAKRSALPKVQFFQGREGLEQAYEDTIENNQEKILRDITGINAVYTALDQTFVNYYLNKRAKLGVGGTTIVQEGERGEKTKADDQKYGRTTRFIPKKFDFDGEVSIYGDKVALFSYTKDHPVALIVEDKTIAHMMKQIFDYIESTTS